MADHGENAATETKRGPSVVLLLAGVVSVAVAVFALLNVSPLTAFDGIRFGWLFVVAAVGIGVVMVLSPTRSRCGKKR